MPALPAIDVDSPVTAAGQGLASAPCSRLPESPKDTLNELHLFAGCGGGILGGILLGHQPCCAVEIEPYARKVLLQRQRDGILPWFPIWDDVTTFDGKPWRGIADVVCGGFPCQDISSAGKGAGLSGERSGLWAEMRRIISEVEPQYVFVENSPMLTLRGLGIVLGDLASMGYDARWGVMGAIDTGAPHERERIWILADAKSQRLQGSDIARSYGESQKERIHAQSAGSCSGVGGWWSTEPDVGRVAHGVANRMERVRAIGNGQVPSVAALAWRILNCENSALNDSPSQYPSSNPPA
jgi:DNA (cytosine-5)-methyltransferase 1